MEATCRGTIRLAWHAMQEQSSSEYRPGDKVRIRAGPHTGARGIIVGEADGLLRIQLAGGDVELVEMVVITNYSLAARRAWEKMPKRAGRPPLNVASKKRSVTIRLDPDIWRRLGEAVEIGLIQNREAAVNSWLRRMLDETFSQHGNDA